MKIIILNKIPRKIKNKVKKNIFTRFSSMFFEQTKNTIIYCKVYELNKNNYKINYKIV